MVSAALIPVRMKMNCLLVKVLREVRKAWGREESGVPVTGWGARLGQGPRAPQERARPRLSLASADQHEKSEGRVGKGSERARA